MENTEIQTIKKENLMPLIQRYYDCWDKTGMCYTAMFPADTDMKAIRMIEESVKNPNSQLNKHPEDYRLDYICTVDRRTGDIIDNEHHKILEVAEYDNGKDKK